ncbi:MAG: response regulator [Gammaproteobacteria bacterium]
METALIIEDNYDNKILISDILELNGYNTLHADTGLSGFAMAMEKQPDFIILDIQLPDINGYEVLDKIRECDATKSIPVVAMTSYAMAGDREKLLNAGCDGYVEKPIDPALVIDQIRQAIEKNP